MSIASGTSLNSIQSSTQDHTTINLQSAQRIKNFNQRCVELIDFIKNKPAYLLLAFGTAAAIAAISVAIFQSGQSVGKGKMESDDPDTNLKLLKKEKTISSVTDEISTDKEKWVSYSPIISSTEPLNTEQAKPLVADKIGAVILEFLGDAENVYIETREKGFVEKCDIPDARMTECVKIEGKLYEYYIQEWECAAQKLLKEGKIAAYATARAETLAILKKGVNLLNYLPAPIDFRQNCWLTNGAYIHDGKQVTEYMGNKKFSNREHFCAAFVRTIDQQALPWDRIKQASKKPTSS